MSDTPRTNKAAERLDFHELLACSSQLERELREARNEALEEAAQMCEKTVYMGTQPTATGIKTTLIMSEDWAKNVVGISYGAAIRALKKMECTGK